MIKPLIHMKPTNAWNNICRDCHRLIKTTGFLIVLSDAWDATPDDKFYLCRKCAKIQYPYYFMSEKEKRIEQKRLNKETFEGAENDNLLGSDKTI